jgi:hypothetical protein
VHTLTGHVSVRVGVFRRATAAAAAALPQLVQEMLTWKPQSWHTLVMNAAVCLQHLVHSIVHVLVCALVRDSLARGCSFCHSVDAISAAVTAIANSAAVTASTTHSMMLH